MFIFQNNEINVESVNFIFTDSAFKLTMSRIYIDFCVPPTIHVVYTKKVLIKSPRKKFK